MSEEEIIKEVKGFLDFEEGISMKTIQGLLDLYIKEKEKNKKLIDGQIETLEKILAPKLLEKFISKDKIIEKIEEIDNNGLNICNEQLNYQMKLQDEAKISILQELLEERK